MKYRLLVIWASVLMALALAFPSGAAEESRVLKVAFPQSPGYSMTTPEGKRYGLLVDFLNEIAKYTNWQYEYIDVENDEILNRFQEGDIDLMGGQYYMDGLEEYFAYPDYNCGYSKLMLLARRNDETIRSYDLRTLNGKTIGVFDRAAENIRRLRIYLELNNLDCTLKYYTYDQLEAAGDINSFLENGEVDLLLGNGSGDRDKFHAVAAFDSQPHYIVTQPGSHDILEGLNMALKKIYEADPRFSQKAYEANFTSALDSVSPLSEEEQAYVRQHGEVTVAIPNEWHPMVCLNNSSSHNGLVPDILSYISDYSGLHFIYRYYDSYGDALAAMRRNEADVLGFFIGDEEDAARNDLTLTASYVELNAILVRNKESSYPAEGLTGGVLAGRLLPDSIKAGDVVIYSDIDTALADVNRGKTDFFYGISSLLESSIQQNNFTNLVQVNMINDNQSISFAMVRPAPPELFSIINKAINSMSAEERLVISRRNMVSIGESRITLANIIYSNPTLAVKVMAVLTILVLLIVILVSRSRLHAAAMRSELARAEADNRAKGEFLSRMSHEIRTPMNAIIGLTELTEMTEPLPEKARSNLAKIKISSKYLLNLINDILDMSRIENGKMELNREAFSLSAMLNDIETLLAQEASIRELTLVCENKISHDVVTGDPLRLRQVIVNLLSNALKFTPAGGTVLVQVLEDSFTDIDGTYTFCVSDTGIGIAAEDQKRIFRSFEQLGSNYSKSQGTGLGLAISGNIVRLMGGELQLRSEAGKGSEFYFTVTLSRGQPAAADEPETETRDTGRNLLNGARILVVEDNDLNSEIALELLSSQGAVPVRAENGRVALELFKESPIGYFDAILMDIMMPEMNGLEATVCIRGLERPDAAQVPIIAMTANAFREDQESAIHAGMNGFIPKPIDVAFLYRELEEALGKKNRLF